MRQCAKCATTKQATDGNMAREYFMLDTKIVSIPLQQWLQERASKLRYKYIASLGEYFILFYRL
jgi:hypothetical protein